LAVRNGCPPWAIVDALGLDVRGTSGDVRTLAYGIVATAEMCEAVEAATGVGAEIVQAMHLDVFNGTAVDLAGVRVGDKEPVRRSAARESVQFFGGRACPECVAVCRGRECRSVAVRRDPERGCL
jgi:hypothetical protein